MLNILCAESKIDANEPKQLNTLIKELFST